jgi:hypothetical protein
MHVRFSRLKTDFGHSAKIEEGKNDRIVISKNYAMEKVAKDLRKYLLSIDNGPLLMFGPKWAGFGSGMNVLEFSAK